jgi:long-chain acyl-CoA synthetase
MVDVGADAETMNVARMIEPPDPDRVALICSHREITYGELNERVATFRGGLAAAGVGKGDQVAILCGNNRYFVVAYLAVVGMGAVAVPLNPSSPAPEIERELDVIDAKLAVVGPHAKRAWAAVGDAYLPDVVVAVEGDPAAGHLLYDDLFESPPMPVVDVDGDHLAVMMFTSGTAGPPRAAMLSHRNLIVNIHQDLTARDHTDEGDIVYSVLPLFHIFGLNVVLGVGLTVGATIILVQHFDPATAAQSIMQRKVTVVPGAPPMWVAFSHFDELPDDVFASVRLAASGASRLAPSVADRMRERYGLEISEGYGLTEASPIVTTSAGLPTKSGSVGRLLVGQEMRIVGDDGEDVPVGDAGEIWVRGDNVFMGYWNEPEATARVLVDGWLRTGDIGTTDEDGYLYLVDRAKDLIIVSGFNVFPAEVEDVIRAHPDVVEVGVLGVPHPHLGEAVKAYVVRRPGSDLDEDGLIDHVAGHLARYKCPRKVLFVDDLPRNAAGKLIRRELEGTIIGD